MILSMTGYGRGNAVLNGRDITVEIRSVNSRFFEYSSKLPRSCLFLDDKLKKLLSARISRGKTELSLQIQEIAAASTTVEVNMELARSYRQALRSICNELDLKDTTSVEALAVSRMCSRCAGRRPTRSSCGRMWRLCAARRWTAF